MSSSKEYYLNQKHKSITHWEKQRENRVGFAFKNAIRDTLLYGIVINLIVNGFPKAENIWGFSAIFTIFLILLFLLHYNVTFKIKDKAHQKMKEELKM